MRPRKASSRNVYLPWERGMGRARPFGRGWGRSVLLVVVAVFLLAVIGMRERHRAACRQTRAALLLTRQVVDAYRADHDGRCPRALDDLEPSGYIAVLPRDAWGHKLRLRCPGRTDLVAYDLTSDGPDGEPGGLDRIE